MAAWGNEHSNIEHSNIDVDGPWEVLVSEEAEEAKADQPQEQRSHAAHTHG